MSMRECIGARAGTVSQQYIERMNLSMKWKTTETTERGREQKRSKWRKKRYCSTRSLTDNNKRLCIYHRYLWIAVHSFVRFFFWSEVRAFISLLWFLFTELCHLSRSGTHGHAKVFNTNLQIEFAFFSFFLSHRTILQYMFLAAASYTVQTYSALHFPLHFVNSFFFFFKFFSISNWFSVSIIFFLSNFI